MLPSLLATSIYACGQESASTCRIFPTSRKSQPEQGNQTMRTILLIATTLSCLVAHAADRPYRAARLPDGRPNMEGIWVQSNNTPLTRPDGIATLVISREQVNEIERRIDSF